MNRLCSLFSHEISTDVPPLQPLGHMVLHDVHLREDGGIGKCVPVEFKESGDVLFCGSMVNLGVLLKYLKQLPVCLIAELVTTL